MEAKIRCRVLWDAGDGEEVESQLEDFTDDEFELSRYRVEEQLGRLLPVNPKTGFPSFTVFDAETGEEIGAG